MKAGEDVREGRGLRCGEHFMNVSMSLKIVFMSFLIGEARKRDSSRASFSGPQREDSSSCRDFPARFYVLNVFMYLGDFGSKCCIRIVKGQARRGGGSDCLRVVVVPRMAGTVLMRYLSDGWLESGFRTTEAVLEVGAFFGN